MPAPYARVTCALSAAVIGLAVTLSAGCTAHTHPETVRPEDSYAIVASASILNDSVWKAATVDELLKKYPNATVITWKRSLSEVKEPLAKAMPSFTAFVVKPGEAGVRFTIDVSHLTRALDDDPYTDTFWGVITGYDAEAARSVASAAPIAIQRALDCSGCDLTAFQKAWRYSENHRGTMNLWDAGSKTAKVQDIPCNTDNTTGVLERLQKDNVQFLATSGHATQHDWQMGYCGPNMQMTHQNGALIAVNTKNERFSARNPEPKVYFANGNCLIGDVDKRDCMALSWMRDGGVKQMMGYTVTTWFGAQGWGTLGLFTDTAGLTTAAEAFHFTNASIVNALEKTIQLTGATDIRACKLRKITHLNRPFTYQLLNWLNTLSEAERSQQKEEIQQIIGNLHDRDVVCFYGDPALETRIADGRFTVFPAAYHPVEQTLTLTVKMNRGERTGALWLRLPGSWTYDRKNILASEALGVPDLLLDNMIRFPEAALKAGDLCTVTLRNAQEHHAQPCQACTR